MNKRNSALMLAELALMIALNIILSRYLVIYLSDSVRIAFGGLPIILAGIMYGPFGGAAVGGIADTIGALFFSPLGWNPVFTISPILLGVLAGLVGKLLLRKGVTILRILILTESCHAICSMCLSTVILTYMYNRENFMPSLMMLAAMRVPLYLVIALVEGAAIYFLVKRKIVRYK